MKSNDRVVEEMARGDLQFKLLAEVSQAIVSSADLDEVLQVIAVRVAEVTGSPICTIRFVEGNKLSIGEVVGYEDDEARKHRIAIDQRLGRVVHDQQPLIVPDLWTAKDIPLRHREWAKREGVRGFLAVPAVYQDKTVAILSTYKDEPHRFTAQEIEVMESIAHQIALAIENARFYHKLQEQTLQTEQALRTTQDRLGFLISATRQESYERFRILAEAPFEGISITANGVIIDGNKALGKMFGYELSEMIGRSVFEFLPPEYIDLVREKILSGYEKPYEVVALKKDGSRLVVEVQGRPMPYKGQMLRVTAVRDITERKRAEKALQESETRYRSLFDGVPVGLYRVSPEGKFLSVNRAYAEILGYPDIESLMAIDGRALYVDLQDMERCMAFLERHGSYKNFEVRLRRRDGQVIWAEDTSREVRGDGGKVNYYEGSIRDITDRKKLDALREQMLETAKTVALGQMAAGVAHELNNPLGAALGYLQLAREEKLFPEVAADYVARIEEQIQHAAKIVREVREFGVPPSPVLQVVDVNQLLKEAVELMQVRGLEPKISIIPTLDSGITPIRGDPAHLTQVFLNLLLNAQEAMPQGGKISIRSRRVRDKIQITISDTGGGIAKEDLLRIFEPFFTTKPGKGMGMGLTVSYRIIQEHKGNIEVQSKKGKGTTFTISLPVEKTGQSDQDHRVSP